MNLRIMSMQNDASHIINLTQIMLLKDLKCFTIVYEKTQVMLHLSSLMSKGSLAVVVIFCL